MTGFGGFQFGDGCEKLAALPAGTGALARAAAGSHGVEIAQIQLQHLPIEEHQGVERRFCVLAATLSAVARWVKNRSTSSSGRCCWDARRRGNQEFLQLAAPHFRRMPFVMEEDEVHDPLHVQLDVILS